ncbi:MAG: hypothetical protein KKC75_00465 [Nanoarchaeota archaeon]|nr:hypothetical protein [Nanoarchaeota archaeon]MBU1005191.1 hypothetical protein [Nanoarchaeota archaeon]MBU1946862.1 hypothetical protein [Nanoarchaeota archaeon]
MAKWMENRLVFRDKWDFVYCNSCKTEMSFNGNSYECPVCGSVYLEKSAV